MTRSSDATCLWVAMAFLLFLLRLALRREWLAALAFVGILVLQNAVGTEYVAVDAVAAAVTGALLALTLFRFGILAFAVFILFQNLLVNFPLTTAVSSWYGGPSLAALLALAGLAVYGVRVALAGRPLAGGTISG